MFQPGTTDIGPMSIGWWDIVFVALTLAFMIGGGIWLKHAVNKQLKSLRRQHPIRIPVANKKRK